MTNTDFEKTMLQQISDVAWLVHQGEKRIGILNKDVQEHYTFISGRELVNFNNEFEVKKHFGNLSLFDVQINTPAQKQDKYYIRGYEVNYPEPFALEEGHPDYRNDLPLFTKIQDSKVYYAAGHYCVNFHKGWKYADGPKLSTLLKYGYIGPFKTKLEAKQHHKMLTLNAKNDRD